MNKFRRKYNQLVTNYNKTHRHYTKLIRYIIGIKKYNKLKKDVDFENMSFDNFLTIRNNFYRDLDDLQEICPHNSITIWEDAFPNTCCTVNLCDIILQRKRCRDCNKIVQERSYK